MLVLNSARNRMTQSRSLKHLVLGRRKSCCPGLARLGIWKLNLLWTLRIGVCSFAPLLLCLFSPFSAAASPKRNPASAVDYNRDIRPIFSDNCYACHGPDQNKRKAGLRLDQKDA